MTLVCRNCSRVNPPEARFCYWDGAVLDGRGQAHGPIAVAAQPFHCPFVFPSGRHCRNFDELVLGCYSEWKDARELLREGYLESFFGALGRMDLAMAAKQAVRAADADSGLDQLLNKLPASNRESPKLFVQPLEVNLGQLSCSSDRQFMLHIENQGMGLLQGSIACEDSAWLMLGEGAGSPRKVFQCLHEFAVPVQIHGKALRAGNKPLEGRLTIESNGGATIVVVHGEVPVQPFPEGLLAGAVSPRQVAEKAKANPKAASPYFENGAVAAWYESNGWTYPVQGPASFGLGAIQQFYEALGLVKAPIVEISETAVHLQGPPCAQLERVLQVRAQEKRPVFAHAMSSVPWLRIGPILLEGRTAHIPIQVPSVPPQPGELLRGKVHITANGGQRFLVEVALTVSGRSHSGSQVAAVLPVLTVADVVHGREKVPEIVAVSGPGRREIKDVLPVDDSDEPRAGFRKHLLPLGFLGLLLFSVVAHDLAMIFFNRNRTAGGEADESALIDPNPHLFIRFHDFEGDKYLPDPTMRFGLLAKDSERPDRTKKLTFDEHGLSNNTVIRFDRREYIFGQPPGEWSDIKSKLQGETAGRPREGLASIWSVANGRLRVTQEVEIVPGTQSRRLDTCLVRYLLENRDALPHRVGIRFMLDTFIGGNDGVPFTIPGASGLCDTKMSFSSPNLVPDFIQALEKDDLRNPGTVAYLQFRIGNNIESPGRVLLGGWPNLELRKRGIRSAQAQLTGWEVPFISMKEQIGPSEADDSAVTMYWNEQMLEVGASRVVGFTYGLGNVDTRESGGHLLLTVGGRLVPNAEFTLTALVHDPKPGESVTLDLPAGIEAEGQQKTQMVPPVPASASRPDSPITWRLRVSKDGRYELSVRSSTGATQKLSLTIRTRGVFD
ncbi:MAG TPA: hypothetical protein VH592_16250 [Gemmataceae bacterium]|jgi:hypothetical protein